MMSSLSPDKKRMVQAIIGVFETGKANPDPSAVALLPDGAGISYGIHQATDRSGSLDAVLLKYLELGGDMRLRSFLPLLGDNLSAKADPKNPPGWVKDLTSMLEHLGKNDPRMLLAQEFVFDTFYWSPCAAQCQSMGLVLPLSWAAVYDTCIQSGPASVGKMRARFPEVPPSRNGGEKRWTRAYLTARWTWISNFVGSTAAHTALVRKTTYRAEALLNLVQDENWNLDTPVALPFGVTL